MYQGAPRAVELSPLYLKAGYFDDNGHVQAGLLTTGARAPDAGTDDRVATDLDRALKALHFGPVRGSRDSGIKVAQLRRFFNYAKQLESRLRSGQPIEEVRPPLLELQAMAAYTVGRGVACVPLLDFIRANVQWAQRDRRHMEQGFIPHFEAVVAYFTYYWGESERR